jgi:hypothetical protein
MTSRYEALRALSERDSESIYRYAMARSKEIKEGLPRGSETSKLGKGKKMRSLYEQCSEAEIQGSGTKITEPTEDGATQDFRVRLDDVLLAESKRGHGVLYIVEFTVVQGTERNPDGCKRSWVEKPAHRPKTGPAAIKAFAAAVAGIEGADPAVPAQVFEDIETGKYKGTELALTVEKITTQAGFPFWKHVWRPGTKTERLLTRPSTQAPITVPDLPAATALTKGLWRAGEGEGTEHPQNSAYEYHPDHPEWGVREAK